MTIPAIRVGDAIMALSGLGYEIGLEGGVIKYKYMGTSPRDADLVRPLLQTIRSSREEAMLFLRIYCPRCGGSVWRNGFRYRPGGTGKLSPVPL